MLVILDPALFLTSGGSKLSSEEDTQLAWVVDNTLRICRETRALIPSVESYWITLQRELIRPLHPLGSPRLKRGLDNLLRLNTRSFDATPEPEPTRIRMWGVKPLFGWSRLGPAWLERMTRLLHRCTLLDQRIVLVSRLFEGRNQITHFAGRCELIEKTRWRVYVQAPGKPLCAIPCIQHPRSLAMEWTARFDERLPAHEDQARYPFCPPEKWWRRATVVRRTVESKPAWVDKLGNAWARPATGGGYHWDVYIGDPNLSESIGLDQLNIVQWGAPESEGPAGHIRHVPGNKASRLKDDTGWTCD